MYRSFAALGATAGACGTASVPKLYRVCQQHPRAVAVAPILRQWFASQPLFSTWAVPPTPAAPHMLSPALDTMANDFKKDRARKGAGRNTRKKQTNPFATVGGNAAIEVVFLGTASMAPSPSRCVSSMVMKLPSGSTWMVDCGEGTQIQCNATDSVRCNKIDVILITHLHGDHSFGLPGMLCKVFNERDATDMERTLHIIGPPGLSKYIRTSLAMSYTNLTTSYVVHELAPHDAKVVGEVDGVPVPIPANPPEEGGGWTIVSNKSMTLKAAALRHTVPCVGYVFEEAPVRGKMQMDYVKPILDANREALKAQGVKRAEMVLRKVVAGEVVELPDGSKLDPADERVISAHHAGRKLVFLGDTCDSSKIADMAKGATVLVHEATNAKTDLDIESYEEIEAKTITHGHSTPQMAGQFAADVGAQMLALTHFSSRYLYNPTLPSANAALRTMASQAYAAKGKQGSVVCAHDFMELRVPARSPPEVLSTRGVGSHPGSSYGLGLPTTAAGTTTSTSTSAVTAADTATAVGGGAGGGAGAGVGVAAAVDSATNN